MMLAEEIIIKPLITEKSNMNLADGKYTFKVNKKATKTQIAKSVEELFNVRVVNVSTMIVKGKVKRVGANSGKRPDWKKAIVTIDVNLTEKTYLTKGAKEVKIDKKYKESIDEFTA